MEKFLENVILSNNKQMPRIGLGTYLMPNDNNTADIVAFAIQNNYSLIDTASVYENEEYVGKGIRLSEMPRENIFVTTKLWNDTRGYYQTLNAIEKSLNLLQLDYLDMYLIHFARPYAIRSSYMEKNTESWLAMEAMYNKGILKGIGVSNFLVKHLDGLINNTSIKPMINQIELSPRCVQYNEIEYCKKNGIVLQSHSSLMRGKSLDHPILKNIANRLGKSTVQVVIKWQIMNGFNPLIKSINKDRLIENLQILDFELSQEDIKNINTMEVLGRVGSYPDSLTY